MTPPQKRQNSITRYRLIEENLIGNVKEPAKNYDLLSVVILCLRGADDENYDGVPKLLDVLLSPEAGIEEKRQILQNDFDIPMTETLESEVQTMCNLSHGVEEKGCIKGYAEGLLASIRNLNSQYWLAVGKNDGDLGCARDGPLEICRLDPEAVTRLPKTNSQANAAQLLSEQRRFSCAQSTELLGICSIW